MQDFVFSMVVTLMLAHELDAVQRREWRLFPLLNRLSDRQGYQVFVWAHVPLFLAIVWFGYVGGGSELFRVGFAAFAVAHVALHLALARHPANEFNNPPSQALIGAAGLAGAAYIWMTS